MRIIFSCLVALNKKILYLIYIYIKLKKENMETIYIYKAIKLRYLSLLDAIFFSFIYIIIDLIIFDRRLIGKGV